MARGTLTMVVGWLRVVRLGPIVGAAVGLPTKETTMYVVRSKQGQKVAAFRTKRAAEVFVRVRSGRRPASARSPGGLPVGRSIFTSHLKIHHYRGALAITDLTNAGKRGAKVLELHVTGSGGIIMSDGVLGSLAEDILPMAYPQARAYLEQFVEGGSLAGPRGTEAARRWLRLTERVHRGVDVERAATAIEIHNSFPDGSQIEISSTPHSFLVKSTHLIHAPGKVADGMRQDTIYSPAGKRGAGVFYTWLRQNMAAAGRMGIRELTELWRSLGVAYDYH